MSTWKAVYVPEDTPTELAGWYVVGGENPTSPVVLKVEGTDIDGERQQLAEHFATLLEAVGELEVLMRDATVVDFSAFFPSFRPT